MRISLLQISLLQFFKTFQKYLAYMFFWLIISLLRFLCYMQNIEKKPSNEIISPKNVLAKYLTNANSANANFFQNQELH